MSTPPQTFTQKALARAAGVAHASPGDVLDVSPDIVLSHDNTAAIARIFAKLPHERVKHPERLAITLDHAAPPPTPRHAKNHAEIREFVAAQGITNFYEVGRGICHQVLSEEVVIQPGRVLVGADSHSTHYGWLGAFGAGIGRTEVAAVWATGELWMRVPETMQVTLTGALAPGVMTKDFTLSLIGRLGADAANYMAVEFDGPAITQMTPDERAVLPNMMAEMGAKNAYIAPDEITWAWLESQLVRTDVDSGTVHRRIDEMREHALYPDEDPPYAAHHHIDLTDVEPTISAPHTVQNTAPLSALAGTPVDVGFIGTCTNGRLEDIEAAAHVLRGKRVRSRLIIIPASSQVMEDAARQGYVADLIAAGATFGIPGCGPCMGNHMGVLAPGETCISSANRNFRGRMGERDAHIYLANPAVVAASALTGKITHPQEVLA